MGEGVGRVDLAHKLHHPAVAHGRDAAELGAGALFLHDDEALLRIDLSVRKTLHMGIGDDHDGVVVGIADIGGTGEDVAAQDLRVAFIHEILAVVAADLHGGILDVGVDRGVDIPSADRIQALLARHKAGEHFPADTGGNAGKRPHDAFAAHIAHGVIGVVQIRQGDHARFGIVILHELHDRGTRVGIGQTGVKRIFFKNVFLR